MDPLGPFVDLYSYLAANYWVLWGLVTGFMVGRLLGFRDTLAVNERHLNTLREMSQLLGHFQAAVEVLDEHDLTEEAQERGDQYAEANLIDMEHREATEPSRLDRLRDRFPL